jgi:hypothetical protein
MEEGSHFLESLSYKDLLIWLQFEFFINYFRLLIKIMIPCRVVEDCPPEVLNNSHVDDIHQIYQIYLRVHTLTQIKICNIPLL